MIDESVAYFDYEMFNIPEDKEKDKDYLIKIIAILLEPFDDITKLLIINSLFGDKK